VYEGRGGYKRGVLELKVKNVTNLRGREEEFGRGKIK
jgi:hypothetical protein